MSCNLTQSRTEYRRKMAAHKAAKKAEAAAKKEARKAKKNLRKGDVDEAAEEVGKLKVEE